MSEHTPEPWVWNGVDGVFTNPGAYKDDLNGPLIAAYIADCESHPLGAAQSIANAKRIVACVNACAGMSDPTAEIATFRERAERLREAVMRTEYYIDNPSAWDHFSQNVSDILMGLRRAALEGAKEPK